MTNSQFGDRQPLDRITAETADFPGTIGYYAKNLCTGQEIGQNADLELPTASVIKVAIMAELYRQFENGEIDLGERVELKASDWWGGTGILKELLPGIKPTVADLC